MDDRLVIRDLLRNLLHDDAQPFSDDDSLVTSGRLQSIDILEVVLFLEDKYGVDFAERGFDQDEFDSVSSILALIRSQPVA